MYLTRETRKCPAEFQDRITRRFGSNKFGDPLFKIVWGQTELFRGGMQLKDGRCVYVDKYKCHGAPCWNIMRWRPPSDYGSPAAYYAGSWMSTGRKYFLNERGVQEFDEPDGFYVCGEYPWTGRYEIVQPLMHREMVKGRGMVIETFPLSHLLVDLIIPLILAYQNLSLEERAAAQALAREEEERKITEEIADRLMDSMPKMAPHCFASRQGCHTALIDKKMDQIQRVWNQLARQGRAPQFSRGMSLGDRPEVITHT